MCLEVLFLKLTFKLITTVQEAKGSQFEWGRIKGARSRKLRITTWLSECKCYTKQLSFLCMVPEDHSVTIKYSTFILNCCFALKHYLGPWMVGRETVKGQIVIAWKSAISRGMVDGDGKVDQGVWMELVSLECWKESGGEIVSRWNFSEDDRSYHEWSIGCGSWGVEKWRPVLALPTVVDCKILLLKKEDILEAPQRKGSSSERGWRDW